MKFRFCVIVLILFLSVSTLAVEIGGNINVIPEDPPNPDPSNSTTINPDDGTATPKPDDNTDKVTTTSGVGSVSQTLLPLFSLIVLCKRLSFCQ
ncbi:hypothetical protein ACTXT7_001794 [Hymenolepis weldensis]